MLKFLFSLATAFFFSLTASAGEAAVQKAYLKSRSRIAVPGFRKGKAPRKIIEKMYLIGQDAGIARTAGRKAAEEVRIETRTTIGQHFAEEGHKGHHTHHQGQEAGNGEHQVEALVRADDAADLGKFVCLHD